MLDDIKFKVFAALRGVSRESPGKPSRLWIAGAPLVVLVVAMRSCTSLEAGQVAVRVNNITESQTTLTRPGLVVRLPFGMHTVHVWTSTVLLPNPRLPSMRNT